MLESDHRVEPLFDSHAHLSFDRFDADLSDVLSRARAEGLEGIINIGSGGGARAFEAALPLALQHHWIWATAGLHPHDARFGTPDLLDDLTETARHPRVVAVGETGLDYHYDFSPRDDQRRLFRAQLRMARSLSKPFVVHTREADADTLALLGEEGIGEAGGVVHCFSGGPELADAVVKLGLHVSFSGIVTFPKADAVREALAVVPDDRLLIETDSPYLTPPPHRGHRNEPAYVRFVCERVAADRGLTTADVARITTRNTYRLFSLERDNHVPIAYPIRDQLYLNVSNRCTLSCIFCPKRHDWIVKGHDLRHDQEPTDAEIEAALWGADPGKYREIVFCGLGEPTTRFELIVRLGRELRARGLRTRLDTDGLASIREGRNVTGELGVAFDAVSVSLNAADAGTYSRLCPSALGESAWEAVVEFLRLAGPHFSEVTASVVAYPGLDVEAARRLAENQLGVRFRARPYNVVG
jgi:TatD DNase family protein